MSFQGRSGSHVPEALNKLPNPFEKLFVKLGITAPFETVIKGILDLVGTIRDSQSQKVRNVFDGIFTLVVLAVFEKAWKTGVGADDDLTPLPEGWRQKLLDGELW